MTTIYRSRRALGSGAYSFRDPGDSSGIISHSLTGLARTSIHRFSFLVSHQMVFYWLSAAGDSLETNSTITTGEFTNVEASDAHEDL